MKVRHGEGVANHIGPEPCVAVRKDVDRRYQWLAYALPFEKRAPLIVGAFRKERPGPAGSKNLACVEAPWAGTGRYQVWPFANALVRIGKARRRSQ